jgi:precorrin-2/cobalt-factor-2 C20-methyltransferase
MSGTAAPGTVYGVGVGPGDPDLMTLRAHRLLKAARHVAFFRKAGRSGQARRIVADLIPEGAQEHPMDYPVTTEIPVTDPRYNALMSDFYAEKAAHLQALAEAGDVVVVLSEGDPFFYGSFMHLHSRLIDVVPVEVVPGVTGMSAAWTATGAPITWGDDALGVLPGTLPEAELVAKMAACEALVIMKIGRHLPKLRRALETVGRAEAAWVVEYAAMPGQRVMRLVEVEGASLPYFSIVIVHGHGRRP